jgi:hypothetical protein
MQYRATSVTWRTPDTTLRTVVGKGIGPVDSITRFSKTPGSIALTGHTDVHRPQRVHRLSSQRTM